MNIFRLIHIYIHKLILFLGCKDKLKMDIIYNSTKVTSEINIETSFYLNSYFQFKYSEDSNEIYILIYQEEENKQEIVVKKKGGIQLNIFPIDALSKSIYILNDFSENAESVNYITSEIEVSILLSSLGENDNTMERLEFTKKMLKNELFIFCDYFHSMKYDYIFESIETNEKFFENFLKDAEKTISLDHISNSSFFCDLDDWKQGNLFLLPFLIIFKLSLLKLFYFFSI